MAYPVTDPIRQGIIDNVVSTIAAIASGATYRTNVQSVDVLGRTFTELREYPALVIAPPSVEYDDGRYPMISCRMNLMMSLAVRDRDTGEAFSAIYDFVEDVRRALFVDITRGGYAVDTHVTSDEPYLPDVTEPILGADLTVTIDYRHRRSDPAAAI